MEKETRRVILYKNFTPKHTIGWGKDKETFFAKVDADFIHKGYFHCWVEKLYIDGYGEQINTVALVEEFITGQMIYVIPEHLKFIN